METKKLRELNLEEMERIIGGIHDREENRRYESEYYCRYCNGMFRSYRERSIHIRDSHSAQSNE